MTGESGIIRFLNPLIRAAILLGAASLFGSPAYAASCCGGGSAAALILPKISQSMIDISLDYEKYDGYWNKNGKYLNDPPDSDLKQYRINLGLAHRLGDNWQTFLSVPFVFNENRYTGLSSSTHGIGDATLGFWYETFDQIQCVWKVRKWEDLLPAAYLGASLLVPTGISPYNDVTSSFDITGRGFYRLDGTLLLDKTIYPWNMSLLGVYGVYLDRPVNREYGNYVHPYHKRLGDRSLVTLSFGYTQFLKSMNSITFTGALSDLRETQGTINGNPDPTTGMEKKSLAGTLAWASMDRNWILKLSYNHTFKQDNMGINFPATDILTVGVTHVFR